MDKINWTTQVTQGTTSLAKRFDDYGIGSGYYLDSEGEVFYDVETDNAWCVVLLVGILISTNIICIFVFVFVCFVRVTVDCGFKLLLCSQYSDLFV